MTTIERSRLKQDPDIFYGLLSKSEREKVKEIVEDLRSYLICETPTYLIAGVGGILRRPDSRLAKDIDLAAVGLKYTLSPSTHRNHSFGNVIDFTETVQRYFEGLKFRLAFELKSENKEIIFHRGGSGPFAQWDKKYGLLDKEGKITATLESELESFGWWGSKGLQVCFPDIRPIDIQFVFNQTPQEWESNQPYLEERPTNTGKGNIPEFPYSILKAA